MGSRASCFILVNLVLLLIFCLECSTQAIVWNISEDSYWAHNCDFVGEDIDNAGGPGRLCSSICAKYIGCTHFSWTLHDGGTCWLKSGTNVSLSNSVISNKTGSVCGVLKKASKGTTFILNVQCPYCCTSCCKEHKCPDVCRSSRCSGGVSFLF